MNEWFTRFHILRPDPTSHRIFARLELLRIYLIAKIEMNLPAGSSTISLLVISDNASVSSLFSDAKFVYGYENEAGIYPGENKEDL